MPTISAMPPVLSLMDHAWSEQGRGTGKGGGV
jgi:hypothetical protein